MVAVYSTLEYRLPLSYVFLQMYSNIKTREYPFHSRHLPENTSTRTARAENTLRNTRAKNKVKHHLSALKINLDTAIRALIDQFQNTQQGDPRRD